MIRAAFLLLVTGYVIIVVLFVLVGQSSIKINLILEQCHWWSGFSVCQYWWGSI